MNIPNRTLPSHGFTRTELLVVLVVVGVVAILWSLAIPADMGHEKGAWVQALSNEKQIYLATLSMEADRISNKDESVGWPGDLVASGTMGCKVTDFVKVLVKNDYLTASDLKIFATGGITPFKRKDVNQFIASPGPNNNCAFTIFCIQDSDIASAIFLSTINAKLDVSSTTFTLDPNARPYGDKGYVILHKGGDGAILRSQQGRIQSLQGTPCKLALSGTAALRAE